jgi:hypothetical protein
MPQGPDKGYAGFAAEPFIFFGHAFNGGADFWVPQESIHVHDCTAIEIDV